ncbi:MAG: hypothetical protein JXR49_00325 [Acidobacteria bacterium]|nr:hypothetical protein [Acidobacteriota bacterium]
MRQWFLLGVLSFTLIFFAGCSSDQRDTEGHLHGEGAMESMPKSDSMKSLQEWIRSEPVDVEAVDVNGDGFVYQDPMDWNVIADEEGKCPKCGMFLVRVSIDEAVKNLKDNGYTVK